MKPWKTLEKVSYYCVRNTNNQLTFVLQNRGQYDFNDPRIVLFFGRNTNDPDCKTKQEKAGRKGIEYPNLYWITNFDYINNKSLLVQITAQKDPIWSNYGDMMNSKGYAEITSSQFNNDHINNKGEVIKNQTEHWPQDEDWNQQGENICPACDNCYDFCGDLRIKRAVPVGYSIPKYPSWQPSFKLLYSHTPPINYRANPTTFNIVDDQGKIICCIPSNVKLRAWDDDSKSEETIKGMLTDASKPCLLFLVDGEHQTTGILRNAKPFSDPVCYPKNKEEYLWEELPKCYHEQPHLCCHSSAQFYFQKKLLFTANLKHLLVRRKNPGLALGYRILVRSSISGILYCFESGDIFYRWELKVNGSVINESIITQLTSSVLMGFIKKGGSMLVEGISSFIPAGTWINKGVGVIKKMFSGDKKDEKDSPGGGFLKDILTGEKYKKLLGANQEKKKNTDKPEKEVQTDRKKKSTGKNQERIVDPAIFYASTVDFDYDFWEFSNRCVGNPFYIRFEHSEVLYNNLFNNNNSSPIQNIHCRFSAFKQLIKVGSWQGNVNLFYDINNTLANICASGTYFYDDLDSLFQPWRPKYKVLQSYTHGDTFNTATAVGEEDVDIITGEKKTDEAISHDNITKSDNKVLFTTKPYLKNSEGYELLFSNIFPNTQDWMGSGWDYNGVWKRQFELPPDTYTYFWKIWNGPEKSGTHEAKSTVVLTISMKPGGGVGKGDGHVEFRLESGTDDQYIPRYKMERVQAEKEKDFATKEYIEPVWEDNKTQFTSNIGQTDPEKLEKLPDFETEAKEAGSDKPEQDLKENKGDTEKLFEKQLEIQKELERVRELEKQLQKELEREKEAKQREIDQEREKETETERENEKETEQEKERENESEQEKLERERLEREEAERKEQEKKEDEGENEDENE